MHPDLPMHHTHRAPPPPPHTQPLIVFNRSRGKAESLAAAAGGGNGVRVAGSVAEVAQGAKVIHLMLADDAACDDVMAQVGRNSAIDGCT